VHTGFFNSAESAVTYATIAAEVILLVRLAWLGLVREFKIFSLFLTFDVLCTVVLMRWDYHSYGYERMWAVSTPVWTFLLAATALELSRGVRAAFPMETGSRTVALFGFLIGMTVSALASMLAHPQAISRAAVLFTMISRRCILSGCILAIMAQGAYLFLGNAPIMRNWRLHRRTLLACMSAVVISLFASMSTHRQYVPWFNLLRGVSLFGCVCAWIAGFRPAFSDLWDGLGWPTEDQVADNIVFYHRQAVLSRKRRRLEGLGSSGTAQPEHQQGASGALS
jgi:hypothetical protein